MLLKTALMCMAMNVYHEARSEPIVGQIAVAQVIALAIFCPPIEPLASIEIRNIALLYSSV